jgi:hypothetical protein
VFTELVNSRMVGDSETDPLPEKRVIAVGLASLPEAEEKICTPLQKPGRADGLKV